MTPAKSALWAICLTKIATAFGIFRSAQSTSERNAARPFLWITVFGWFNLMAKDLAKKGSALWNNYYNEVLAAYMDYFNSNYNSSRAPVVIADHFSKWNDGVYWASAQNFRRKCLRKSQCSLRHLQKLSRIFEYFRLSEDCAVVKNPAPRAIPNAPRTSRGVLYCHIGIDKIVYII